MCFSYSPLKEAKERLQFLRAKMDGDASVKERAKPVIYHANFCEGLSAKQKKLQDNGLWDGECVRKIASGNATFGYHLCKKDGGIRGGPACE